MEIVPSRFRKRLFLGAAIVLGLTAALVYVENARRPNLKATPNELRIGAERFKIPRNYIEGIYKSPTNVLETSVRMSVYYPDFTPMQGEGRRRFDSADIDGVDHRLIISFGAPSSARVSSADYRLSGRFNLKLEPAPYNLLEVHDNTYPNPGDGDREYVGDVDGYRVLIECQDYNLKPPPAGLAYFCEYKFPFLDLEVHVHFGATSLADWFTIYRKTKSLLEDFKER
ncbi:MAG TPA: hypothetical protein VHT51_00350 [Micropepsaceae bacterium]|jgi:hypothetical protein|nr:hypothetical protein [Micropepsaceae bacterium]